MRKSLISSLVSVSALLLASTAQAALINWTDWTSATTTNATGTVQGITVDFTGPQSPASQTSGGGTNYWAVNPSIYTATGIVDNGPEASTDIIRVTNNTSYTLQFSQAVVDPVMAIMSLGQTGRHVRYAFSEEFDVLNSGRGYWGGSTSGSLFEEAGNVLLGVEGHGIIQFKGTFDSISWTSNPAEHWHGFQIGIAGVASSGVPEPMPIVLLGLGLISIGFVRRLKKSQ